MTAASEPSTLGSLLARAAEELRRAGTPEPRLDAELLLACLLGIDRGRLLARREESPQADQTARYAEWIARRARREPCQHIVGSQEFYGLTFRSDRRGLIPRPETEGLIDALLELDLPRGARVLDLGTGSGCIAIALAVQRRDLRVLALDRSADALALAGENAALHGLDERLELVRGDLAAPPPAWVGTLDAVVSNPPYVSAEEWERLEPEVRDHDPREALVPGPTGLEAYRVLVGVAFELLKPGGALVLELGHGQSEQVRELAGSAGFHVVRIEPDLRAVPRVLVAQRSRT